MLLGQHGGKTSDDVVAPAGDNDLVVGDSSSWINVHELIGSLDVAGVIYVLAGARVLAKFDLGVRQGLTENDEPGNAGVPRFQCRPGENFILRVPVGSIFTGSIDYSRSH